jgi:hypothetical protein
MDQTLIVPTEIAGWCLALQVAAGLSVARDNG